MDRRARQRSARATACAPSSWTSQRDSASASVEIGASAGSKRVVPGCDVHALVRSLEGRLDDRLVEEALAAFGGEAEKGTSPPRISGTRIGLQVRGGRAT
jgi:hypothetical protein